MSKVFEVLPTIKNTPNCNEIVRRATELFMNYLKDNNISKSININIYEVDGNNIIKNPQLLTMRDKSYTVFNINNEGEIYVFYFNSGQIDKECWKDEILINENAKFLKNELEKNFDVGYYWDIKRTAGQPAIVNLFYGYLAIAIGEVTNGIIYSDDGAWDYSVLPMETNRFKEEYLNIEY